MLPALDVPIDGRPGEQTTAIALGLRGTELYRAAVDLAGRHPNAAQALLRALVEVAILARWIEGNPALRVRLWLAEDDRNRLTATEGYESWVQRRGLSAVDVFEPSTERAMRADIEAARATGRRAGEPVPERGHVLPTLEAMARTAPELWEAYHLAYRVLSPWTHAAGRSLVGDELERRGDGTHLRAGRAYGEDATVALAVGTMFLVLETVSRQLGLGLEAEAAPIRDALATAVASDGDT